MALHEVQLKGYSVRPGNLSLGTFGSYGIEQLHVTLDDTWSGLAVTATFNPPEGEPVERRVPENGLIDVPAEATANEGTGTIVYCGVANGVQRITKTQGYNVITRGPVGGTAPFKPSESLATQVLQAALNAEKNSAEAKSAAKNAAKDAADTVKPYKEETVQAATAAALSEKNVAESKTAAQEAAERATQAGIAASNAADKAERSAGIASDAADGSALNAENAQKSALNAQQSANNAAESQSSAKANADAAAKSQQSAAIDAKTASDSKVAAAGSAEAAADSANAAENSASAAAGSEQAAGASEEQAAVSERAAEGSADAAAKSAQAALESKTAAATSETNAAASAKKAQDVSDSLPADYTTAVNDIGTLKNQMQLAYPDDSSIGENPWSSKNIVDMLCPPLEESGNPVVCYPVAGYPLGVKAKWEPIQEGSGTPYPAGGGKNLFNPAWMPGKTVNGGVTWTITNDGIVTANGAAAVTSYYNSDYFLLPAGTYTISAMPYFRMSILNHDSDGTAIAAQQVGRPYTFTVENDIQKASLFFAASGTLDKVSAKPQIEKGSAATAYAPYENIRPIKGRDSVTVERCGENLLPFGERIENIYTQQIMTSDDLLLLSKACAGQEVTLTFTVETQNIVFEDAVEDEWRKRIGFECHGTLADGTETWGLQCWLDNGAGELTKNGKKTKTVTATVPKLLNGNITFYAQNIKSGSFVAYDFGIYVGTTAPTTYTPYIGQTNTLTLPETVYGGEVDAVSGEGIKNWERVAFDGTEEWRYDTRGFFIYSLPKRAKSAVVSLCDRYTGKYASTAEGLYTESKILVVGTSVCGYTTVSEWKAYLAAQNDAGTPVQIAYKLAEPVPFTATGAQPIPALAGANTVLTDADSATVTGRADPIKRITDLEAAVASIN